MDFFEDFELTGLSEPLKQNHFIELKYKLHTLVDEKLSKEDLLRNYEETYRLRHDFTHLSLSKWLNIDVNLGTTKSIKQHFPNVIFEKNMHPDIVEVIQNYVIIGDVSVSNDVNLARSHKIQKYQHLCKAIEEQLEYKVLFITFILKPSLSNIDAELQNLLKAIKALNLNLQTEDFDQASLISFYWEVDGVQQQLRELISNDTMLNHHLAKTYGDEDIFTEGVRTTDFPDFNPKYLQNLDTYSFKSEEEVLSILNRLTEDDKLMDVLAEKQTKPKDFESAFEFLEMENNNFQLMDAKPSIYTPVIGMDSIDLIPEYNEYSQFPTEQKSILNLFKFIITNFNLDQDKQFQFVSDFCANSLKLFDNDHEGINKNLFSNGFYISKEKDEVFKKEYHELRDKIKVDKTRTHSPFLSFYDFLQTKGVHLPPNDQPRSIRQKVLKIPHSLLKPDARLFFNKAHVGTDKDKKDINLGIDKKTIPLSNSKYVEGFLDYLMSTDQNFQNTSSIYEEFLLSPPGMDIPIFTKVKGTSLNLMSEWLNLTNKYNIYNYMKIQAFINEQLMHFLQFSSPNNQYALFNSGIKNFCYIMPIGYQNKGNDAGKSFTSFGVTDNLRHIHKMYGSVVIKKGNFRGKDIYLYLYNWRRLTAERANFLRDHYYTVLSTSLSTLFRSPRPTELPDNVIYRKIRRTFCVRTLINLSCAQIVAERCADMKNIIMHAFSEYSNVFDLITDKFSPPYRNNTEVWIISKILQVKHLCDIYQAGNNVHLRQPIYIGSKRMVESLGGKLSLPSIWSDDTLIDTQDLLDDLFLYVHTPKEPSNIHHENIKAVETILKFQNIFDDIPQHNKNGEFHSDEEIIEFLSKPTSVGFHKDVLYNSVKFTLDKLNLKSSKSEIEAILNEDLLEISSTRSCIPELKRKIIDEGVFKKNLKKNKREKVEETFKDPKKFPIVDEDLRMITEKGYLYEKNSTNRMKVHDSILDFLISHNKHFTKTLELALWNINDNNSRVSTDICIKAQYGAKREFYVVNLGAKAMVRIFENSYKLLCKCSPNEMISVPGDKKLLHMQDKVNKLLITKSRGKLLYSVNGDCTKWSAAETLQSFDVMSYALKGVFSDNHVKFLRHVCTSWANKLIYTPVSLIKNFKFRTDKTSYLTKDVMGIHSTQNFLQGMMNYSSSFKAVCCSNYTLHLWKKLNPWSTLELDHLEHSDDYLLLIKVADREELMKFRRFHRIMMKLHGFNDSVKKTNTQRLLTEFISLIAFNGQMTYPQIKKTKEVGMNTSCTGFKDDMDTALSRCAEATRIGVDQVTSYCMLRIHQLNILRSYSLLPGMLNSHWNIIDIKNTPVELFGVPDILPSIYMLTTGNVNNYRLYKFKDEILHIDIDRSMKFLFRQAYWQAEKEIGFIQEDLLSDKRLYSPKYSYDQENKQIKQIRSRLKINFEDCKLFLENHKSYNFMKPRTFDKIKVWMHSLYFKPTFAIAYSRMSRAQLTLRLSRLTKTKCVLHPDKDNETLLTLKQYLNLILFRIDNTRIDNWHNDESRLFNRVIISNDPTAELIYSMLEDAHIAFQQEDYKVLTASLMPVKPTWITISNPITSLFQFIFNTSDFIEDNRKYRGLSSLSKDKEALETMYGITLCQESSNSIYNTVFKDLLNLTKSRSICMSYTSNEMKFEDFVKMIFEHQVINGTKFDLILSGTTEARNPYTTELYFRKQQLFTKDQVRLCIDDMLIVYGFLKHTCQLEKQSIKSYFLNLSYNDKILKTTYPCLKLLKNYGFNNFVNTDPKPYELKAYCFLKWILLDDPEPAYNLLNHVSSYSFKYFKPKNRSVFEEAVFIRYQNSTFMAFKQVNEGNTESLNQEENNTSNLLNQVFIIGDTIKKYKYSMAYLIALKLFSLISTNLFDSRLGNVSISQIRNVNTLQLLSLKEEMPSQMLNFFNERWDPVTFEQIGTESESNVKSVPFVYCPEIGIHSNLNLGTLPNNLYLDEENSTIMIGSLKYFTAPYLQCKQVGILTQDIELPSLLGIKFNWWIQHSHIQDLLHNNINKLKDPRLHNYLDVNTLQESTFNMDLTYKRIMAILEFEEKSKYIVQETIIEEDLTYAENIQDELFEIGFNYDDIGLDFGDELLGDEEVIREDNEKVEDASGSSESEDKQYIEFKTIEEYSLSTPYFISETNITFSLSRPRSLDYLSHAKQSVSELIFESSKSTQFLYGARPFHKLIIFITFLNNYKKWKNDPKYSQNPSNKLPMFLLQSLAFSLIETLSVVKFDYINEEFVVIQRKNTLSLCYFVDSPDVEDIDKIRKTNNYILMNNNLHRGQTLIESNISVPTNKEEVFVTITEDNVKEFIAKTNIFEALGFIYKEWIKFYNLIETEYRINRKNKLNMFVNEQLSH